VAARLAPDEAFIEYLVSDDGSMAFVVTRDTLAALSLGVDRRDLARLVDFARATLQPRGSPRMDSLWRAPLRQLHQDLIAPIEQAGLLAGKRRLIFAPHAELHYLPFAALVEGAPRGRFLVERYQVMVTPSASVWLALGARPRARATAGVLALAPRPDALPASRAEVAAIGGLGGPDTRVLVGSAATKAAFRRDAANRRVIHLATYGVLNKQNPLFSFVEMAPGPDDDGELSVYEVFGLDLSADLVVLSACQTGLGSGALGDVPAGDDWIGLSRAFLSAGAGRVIATLWPVQDQASAALMERFYQRYALDPDAGRALAAAQRVLLADPATASPYYWAGFELVGGR
jgi:CHAT domain-containing protein